MIVGPLHLQVEDEAAMMRLGKRLCTAARPGLVIYLRGTLGVGKTTLSRAFIQGLGHSGAVKSPTYTLVEPYNLAGQPLYHFDLYRLGDPEELEFMGIRDYFQADSICLIEWPERGTGFLPPADIVITIEASGAGRCVTMACDSEPGKAVLADMQLNASGQKPNGAGTG